MTITVHEVRARKSATPVLVQATEPQPGLRIYLQPDELLKAGDRYVWRLGHHSGLVIAKFEHRDEADDAAWAIREITDWTRSAEKIRAGVDSDIVRDALEMSPGILLSRKAPAP